MKKWLFATMLLLLSSTLSAQSVVKPTGNPPRFPKAYKELQQQTKPPSNNWLLDANDDTERFRRLQVALSGTEMSMLEIAHRFESLHIAISKNNWDMGIYNWEKMRDRMNTAAMKRPARTQNLEDAFLENGVWKSMHDALHTGNAENIRAEFHAVRKACMNCHTEEKVGFLNDNAVFSRTEKFPPGGK